jgi:predicted lysophospholipase L1 biosynthesis ABC-type transport system permease subunit
MPSGTSREFMEEAAPPPLLEATASQRLIATAASVFAIACFSLGLIGSAFDEASAADVLLPVDVTHAFSWPGLLNQVVWFAIANLVVGAGIFSLGDWIAARRRARAIPRWSRDNRRR